MVKAIIAGATVVEVASEFVANGVGRSTEMLNEFQNWMTAYEYDSVDKLRGVLSAKNLKNPGAFERANYMKALQSYDNKLP
jgi:dihydroorotate dehydrogenase (fumarate)